MMRQEKIALRLKGHRDIHDLTDAILAAIGIIACDLSEKLTEWLQHSRPRNLPQMSVAAKIKSAVGGSRRREHRFGKVELRNNLAAFA